MDMMNGSDTAEADTKATTEQSATGTTKSQTKAKAKKKPEKREIVRSTIGFPYRDLSNAIAVAQSILGAGGVALTVEQLAGVMDLQVGSGNFVMKLASARAFGLVTYQNSMYALTDLGFEILDKDEKRQRQARRDAFLNVALYKRTYDEFRGRLLPPRPHGLEQAFVKFGVSAKQKEAARQIFEKSAQQAGFFDTGTDKLVEPIIAGGSSPPPAAPTIDEPSNSNGRQVSEVIAEPKLRGRHPFIQGLLDTLPEPGTNWGVEGRAKWLMAAAHNFDLIYMGAGGEVQITAKPSENKPRTDKQ
jgi:hypothetical protein